MATKLQKLDELTEPPIVGKFYLVPCVQVRGKWLPIIGEKHSDAELGITKQHYHYDVRFFSDGDLRKRNPAYDRLHLSQEQLQMGEILYTERSPGYIVNFLRRKCRRQMPDFPLLARFKTFHQSYVGKKVLCGRCPHRNMPLENLPRDANNRVVCNGHGLLIDMGKGRVVKRERHETI